MFFNTFAFTTPTEARALWGRGVLRTPVAFEYRGRKGCLNLVGRRPCFLVEGAQVGFYAAPLLNIPAAAFCVSRPPGRMDVNPFGWAPWSASGSSLCADFLVYSNATKIVPLLEATSTLQALQNLAQLFDRAPVSVHVSPGKVVVEKLAPISEARDQLRLVHSVIDLLQSLPQGESAYARRIAPGPSPHLCMTRAQCEVCGNPLVLPLLVCRDCSTPHHADCWQYTGGCSTYACLGRDAQRVDDQAQLDALATARAVPATP